MERRLRALEEEMAPKHEDEAELDRLSREYARLTDRFEDAGGYEWPSRIQGVLAGLGFAKGREDQPASVLSGGEKTRLCLARLLLTQPDLLMLDEPTNHLDLSSIQWLEDTLKKYRGTVLIISHDRYFMNSVCDCMAEISMRRLVDVYKRQAMGISVLVTGPAVFMSLTMESEGAGAVAKAMPPNRKARYTGTPLK